MPRLTKAQKEAVATFRSFTETDEATAIACLTRVEYSSIENAVNHYYNHQDLYPNSQPAAAAAAAVPQQQVQPQQVQQVASQPAAAAVVQPQQVKKQPVAAKPKAKDQQQAVAKVESELKKVFDQYANDPADNLPDKIGPNGVLRLLNDLKLDAEDRKVLILAYKMGAEVMCEFSWAEWNKGMQDMRAISVDSLRTRLDEIDAALKGSDLFKPLYQFTFDYGKNAGQRNLELEVAVVYWKILFKNQFALLPLWQKFISDLGKPVTKDTWNLLFDFAHSVNDDLSDYDEHGAWPVVLDKFVHWARDRLHEEMQSSLMP